MKYNWNWGVYWQQSPEGTGTYAQLLLSGLEWTIITAVCAWAIALLVGSAIGVMRTTNSLWAKMFGAAWVELFRNIPILVQLFLWYFVLPEVLPKAWGMALKQSPNASFYTAVIGLGFATSSRVAEQVRAGINALPTGQSLAGAALGLSRSQTYQYVLLPMAFRTVLPPLTSEFLNLIKNTSVALTIGLLELTARTRAMQEYSFQVFEAFTAATVLYLLLNVLVVGALRVLENRVAVPGFTAGK